MVSALRARSVLSRSGSDGASVSAEQLRGGGQSGEVGSRCARKTTRLESASIGGTGGLSKGQKPTTPLAADSAQRCTSPLIFRPSPYRHSDEHASCPASYPAPFSTRPAAQELPMRARDIMTRDPQCCRREDTARRA